MTEILLLVLAFLLMLLAFGCVQLASEVRDLCKTMKVMREELDEIGAYTGYRKAVRSWQEGGGE